MLFFTSLLLLAAEPAWPGRETVYDLRTGIGDARRTGPGASNLVQPTPEGVAITLPEGHKTGLAGFVYAIRARGDFEVTMAFEELKATKPKSGQASGVSLYVTLDSPDKEAATLSRAADPKSGEVYVMHRAITKPADKGRTHWLETAPARGKAGRLRLERAGAVLKYLAAEPDREFRLLSKIAIGTADLGTVRLAVDPGASTAGASARLTELRVRTREGK